MRSVVRVSLCTVLQVHAMQAVRSPSGVCAGAAPAHLLQDHGTAACVPIDVRTTCPSSGVAVYPHSTSSRTPRHSAVLKMEPTLKADRRWSHTTTRGSVCRRPDVSSAPLDAPPDAPQPMGTTAKVPGPSGTMALKGASFVVTGNEANSTSSLNPREYLRSIGSIRFKKCLSEKSRVWSIRGASRASSRQSV